MPVPSPTVRGRLTAIVLSAFVLLFSLQPALATSIQTDLWVYNNGDTVTVSGDGFGPDESVNLTTTDPNGTVVDQGTAQTDPIGGFTYAFTLNATVGGLEHSPALRNERDPHERADGSVVVRDQDRRNALRRGRSLIAHSATLRLWQTIGQA